MTLVAATRVTQGSLRAIWMDELSLHPIYLAEGIYGMRLKSLFVATICIALGAAASVSMGQDVNWDLLNYHISNPNAVLAGRLNTDLDPAGLQSYFNPILDIPFYSLATDALSSDPKLLYALMGLPYGVLIFTTICISRRLFARLSEWPRAFVVVAATAAAVTGSGCMAQVGTAFNEVPIAMLVLAGLLVLLATLDGRSLKEVGRELLIGGCLVGLAAGLKLTALIFAPAMCLSMLAVGTPVLGLRRAVSAATISAGGWLLGFTLASGWWSARLVAKFANPVFPLFNAFFHSEWFPPVNFFDERYLPRTPMQWIFYPFWWATWHEHAVNSELAYRDPRLALGMVSLMLIFAVGLVGWFQRTLRHRQPTWRAEERLIFSFSVFAYLFWVAGSAIMRYDVVLEVVGTLSFSMFLVRLAGYFNGKYCGPVAAGTMLIASAGCILWTKIPDFGHIPFGPRVFSIDMTWTPPHALFVAITGPTAYLTAFVPPEADARVVGFSFVNRLAADWRLNKETVDIVQNNKGPIFVLVPGGDDSMLPYLPLIGLNATMGQCRTIESNLDHSHTRACVARRLDIDQVDR